MPSKANNHAKALNGQGPSNSNERKPPTQREGMLTKLSTGRKGVCVCVCVSDARRVKIYLVVFAYVVKSKWTSRSSLLLTTSGKIFIEKHKCIHTSAQRRNKQEKRLLHHSQENTNSNYFHILFFSYSKR